MTKRSRFCFCGTPGSHKLDRCSQRFYFHRMRCCFVPRQSADAVPLTEGKKQRHNTALPASRQPSSAPSVLIHLTVASHRLVHTLFTTSKHCFIHYPWGEAALLWTTLTFICYLESFGQPRSALNVHFHSLRQHSFFYPPSAFFQPLLLFFAAKCSLGSEFLISRCHNMCCRGDSAVREPERSRQDF